ncbi:MAG: hypothetical protein Q4D76_04630 [Oscillospiraceae bacterium]|nr:hypothetical protein [Oscillospiraceae bacterium]
MDSIEFALENYIKSGFFNARSDTSSEYHFTETDSGGESDLSLTVSGKHYCTMNYDKNNRPNFIFLKPDKKYGMLKCVDHFVIKQHNDKWDLYMFEFKTTVGFNTWNDIKGKFRASLLSIRALCVYLGIEIDNVYAYTTYETDKFKESQDTNPVLRKSLLGVTPYPDPEIEWNSGFVCLNTFDKVKFPHSPILLKRNEKGVLCGEFSI